jgi:hypothetical protein
MKEVTMLKSLGIVVGALALTAGALSATSVDAATVCKKKSGVMIIRDACKAKETAVNLADFGAMGPMGPAGAPGAPGAPGTDGAAGSARAWAVVDNSGPTISSSKLITAVASPIAGTYCLTPDPSIDATTAATMVTVEWYHSSGFDLLAQVVLPVSDCPVGTFEVKTYDTAGTVSTNIAFVFMVL